MSQAFHMRRITAPGWAKKGNVERNTLSQADWSFLQRHRGKLLELVDEEVETYLNTPDLYSEGTGTFPDRLKMTGEYYYGRETYVAHATPTWLQIGIECRCLEKPWYEGQKEFDYLGLEVWLRCQPPDTTFLVIGCDSSSI